MADRLQPRPIPQPPPGPGQLPPAQLPGAGKLPMRTGQIYMTDYTQQQLKALGWAPGDPVPGDLGKEVERIQREIQQDIVSGGLAANPPPGYQPVKAEFADITSFPEEKQAELRQYLIDYKEEMARRKAAAELQAQREAQIPSNIQGTDREATLQAMDIAAAATAGQDYAGGIIDDRQQLPEGLEIPEGKQFGGSLGGMDTARKIQKLAQAQQQAQQPNKPEPPPAAASEREPAHSGVAAHAICPRCLWNQHDPFEFTPTQEDKQRYAAATLGIGRFKKSYLLLDGKLELFFQGLTTTEITRLNEQLHWHIRRHDISGDGEYWLWQMEYRMVMSLYRITAMGSVVKQVISLEEFETANPGSFERAPTIQPHVDVFVPIPPPPPKPPTGLLAMREWFYREIVQQESMRAIIGIQHREFSKLLEGLDHRAKDRDFWKGIEPLA